MVSNHLGFWFNECADSIGLASLMPPELVLVSSEVGCSKPGAQIFKIFLERLSSLHPGLGVGDCVFVDDKVDNVDAAKALGFKGVVHDARKAAPGDLERALLASGLPLD